MNVFRQPYLSNGRTVVMVVVHPSVIRHGCTMAKRCEIGPRLLLIINKCASHIGFQMTWKSSTLDDLESHWQPVRSTILATAGLLVFKSSPVDRLRSRRSVWMMTIIIIKAVVTRDMQMISNAYHCILHLTLAFLRCAPRQPPNKMHNCKLLVNAVSQLRAKRGARIACWLTINLRGFVVVSVVVVLAVMRNKHWRHLLVVLRKIISNQTKKTNNKWQKSAYHQPVGWPFCLHEPTAANHAGPQTHLSQRNSNENIRKVF